jgi:hypothetical protein
MKDVAHCLPWKVRCNELSIRFNKPEEGNHTSPPKTKTCEVTKEQLTPQLTPRSPKQGKIATSELPPDLAEIVAVWPDLPGHIKAAIKALIRTGTKARQ